MDKNKYNPNTGEPLQPGQSVAVGNSGTMVTEGGIGTQPITLDQLKTKETPAVTPQPVINTSSGLPESLPGATSPEIQLEKERSKIMAEGQKQETGITDLVKLIGGEEAKKEQYVTEAGGDIAQKEYDALSEEYATKQRQLEIAKRNLSNQGLTQEQVRTSSEAIERQANQELADIAIQASLKLNKVDKAKEWAQKKVDAAIKPLQADLDARKFIFENNKDLFSKAESAKLDSLLKQEENKIAREEKTLDTIEQIKIKAAENGMKSFTGFDKVKTVDEALNLAGSYLNTPQTEVVKLDNGSTVLVDKRTGKIVSTLGGAKSIGTDGAPSEFSSIVSRTAAMEGTVAGKEAIANDLNRYLKNQDYSSAYNQIENTVANGLTGTSKTTFQDARIDSEILKNLKTKIQDFENAGGDTGLLKGTAEQITRKLGQVKDPALASLAVELTREFQKYRVGMTGAAFSPKESRDYASVNPKTTNNFDLNIAVIDGAISQLDNRVNSTVDSTIKGAGDIRKLADIPKNNAREVSSNPFLKVSQSIGQIYNSNTGWVIPKN